MLRNGVPVKDVAYMLGHSDAATTIRVYAHAIPSTLCAHAQMIGGIHTGGPPRWVPRGVDRSNAAAYVVDGTRSGFTSLAEPRPGRSVGLPCMVRWPLQHAGSLSYGAPAGSTLVDEGWGTMPGNS
jgi:hypothetical protein